MPKISIVMPAYNAEKTVRQSVESAINQTFTDFELIVINDCSTDSTEEILLDMASKDERIVYHKNEKNSGVSYTRNRAVEYARGEWIAFLDSDDMWREDKLEKQMALSELYPDMKLCYTGSSFVNEGGEAYGYIMEAAEKTTYKELLKGNVISCSSVMIRADVMKQIKMPNDKMHEDYYVWLTVMKDGTPAYGINEPLLIYRLSANSKSSGRLKSAMMLYNSYRAMKFNFIKTAFLVFRYTFYSVRKRKNIKSTANVNQ